MKTDYRISERTYKAIYRLLNMVSPLDSDCGLLCGAACCQATGGEGDEALGIYLYPGEESIHDKNDDWLTWTTDDPRDYEFPESWTDDVYFVNCRSCSACKREIRPIQCRTFPLMPYLTEDGELQMIYNDEMLPYECPLIEDEIPLNDSFVKATRTVWKHLLRDRRIYDLVELESRMTREAEFE